MKRVYKNDIDRFNLPTGYMIAGKYRVVEKLGGGWEGEVYRVREKIIGADRAAKIFFPVAGDRNRTARFYARKLHKLRNCPILIKYSTQEKIIYEETPITVLISEYVEGELLYDFVRRQRGRRLTPFEALHLLYELALGIEIIHTAREYHGDLHDYNILIRRKGLSFNVKVVDMYNWGAPSRQNIRDDVIDMIRIFYDSMGGAKHYAKLPAEVKAICCGLKKSLITRKFRTAGHLRKYIESIEWE